MLARTRVQSKGKVLLTYIFYRDERLGATSFLFQLVRVPHLNEAPIPTCLRELVVPHFSRNSFPVCLVPA